MREIEAKTTPGLWVMVLDVILLLAGTALFIWSMVQYESMTGANATLPLIAGLVAWTVGTFVLTGFFTLQPNEAAALILFGDYRGTIRSAGWHWATPFYTKRKISLRSRNLNGEKLKVNDQMGNPIEIAAVVVWRVFNTVEALFEVESYTEYVKIQSESALRHLAGQYPYDASDDELHLSLRGATEEVSEALKKELQERLGRAGVVVEEARLSHLAYAPEIAAAMLQRQQATAIIAARKKIVEGAVGMVQMALEKLADDGVVSLDDDRKAAMVSNLLVVLCGERSTQPIVNTGVYA